jgi:arsenate reductase
VNKSKLAACTIYHNPRCSKSRTTLSLLRSHGVDPVVIEYLATPPTAGQLKELLKKLNLRPAELLRKGEETYQTQVAGKNLTDDELIVAMASHPVLIERPIVVCDDKAVLGRPPENVLQLLQK